MMVAIDIEDEKSMGQQEHRQYDTDFEEGHQ